MPPKAKRSTKIAARKDPLTTEVLSLIQKTRQALDDCNADVDEDEFERRQTKASDLQYDVVRKTHDLSQRQVLLGHSHAGEQSDFQRQMRILHILSLTESARNLTDPANASSVCEDITATVTKLTKDATKQFGAKTRMPWAPSSKLNEAGQENGEFIFPEI